MFLVGFSKEKNHCCFTERCFRQVAMWEVRTHLGILAEKNWDKENEVSRGCEKKYGYKERKAQVLLDIKMYPDFGKILFICTKSILYIFFLKLQLYYSSFLDSVVS